MASTGNVRERVRVESNRPATDDYGQSVADWQHDAPEVWGRVEYRSGREYQRAAQTHAELAAVIEIRYRPDVRPQKRVAWVGRGIVFDIGAVIPDEKRLFMKLLCTEQL